MAPRVLWGVTLATAACLAAAAADHDSGHSSDGNEVHHKVYTAPDSVRLDWGYGEANGRGPSGWTTRYPACGGNRQSPVDLNIDPARGHQHHMHALHYHYKALAGGYTIVNKQTGISIYLESHGTDMSDPNQKVEHQSDGKRYHLTEIALHAPAEHTLAGVHADMEVQLVHKEVSADEPGEKHVIVSMLFNAGGTAPNVAFGELFKHHLPDVPQKDFAFYADGNDNARDVPPTVRELVQHSLDLRELFPARLDYAMYAGSLTAPPCDESVRYYVYTTPSTVSRDQLADLRAALALSAEWDHLTANYGVSAPRAFWVYGNARPTRALHDREVVFHMAQNTHHGGGRGETHYDTAAVGSILGIGVFLAAASLTAVMMCR